MKENALTFEQELVFMPVDGTKNIKPVVSIITGKEELPIVLLDSDTAGEEKKEKFKKEFV